jgi:hypothetical protein
MMWTPPQTILRPDAKDAPSTEFYLMKVFRYADRWVGLVMVYYADPKHPNRHSGILRYELVVSRDGHAWERPYRYTDMGIWTYTDPFQCEGKLCFVAHHKGSISMFAARSDGLVSCGSRERGGFWTPPFEMPANPLLLNADCTQGRLGSKCLTKRVW